MFKRFQTGRKALVAVLLAIGVVSAAAAMVFAAVPSAIGASTYGTDPFAEDYAKGYLDLTSVTDYGSAVTVTSSKRYRSTNNGSVRDPNVYLDYDNGAYYDGTVYAVREYIWIETNSSATRWEMSMTEPEIIVPAKARIHREFHFYESGHIGDSDYEISEFKGVVWLTDFDSNEGYDFLTSYDGVWANNPANIKHTDGTNIWLGTGDTSKTAVKGGVWAQVYGTPSSPLHIVYVSPGSRGSWLYNDTVDVTFQLSGEIPSTIFNRSVISVAKNGLYDPNNHIDTDISGYTFSGWYKDAKYTEPVTSALQLTADTTFYGKFTKSDTPEDTASVYTSVTNGLIDASKVEIEAGTSVTINYSPSDSSYKLAAIAVDGEWLDPADYPSSYTFTNIAEGDHSIAVSFVKNGTKSYTIYTSAVNGTIEDSRSVVSGTSATFEFAPHTGYHLARITVDGDEVSTSGVTTTYTLNNVQKNMTLEVTFVRNGEEDPSDDPSEDPEDPVDPSAPDTSADESATPSDGAINAPDTSTVDDNDGISSNSFIAQITSNASVSQVASLLSATVSVLSFAGILYIVTSRSRKLRFEKSSR